MDTKNKSNALSEWEQGVLMAVSILIATHDQGVAGAGVLSELGLSNADCSQLDDYDKRNLAKVQGELGGQIKLLGLALSDSDEAPSAELLEPPTRLGQNLEFLGTMTPPTGAIFIAHGEDPKP